MNPDFANTTISAGQTLSTEVLQTPELSTKVDFMGYIVEKDLILVLIAAVVFIIGLAIGCYLPNRRKNHRKNSLLCAPITFLITAPIWISLMKGQIMPTNIAVIDAILGRAIRPGEIFSQLFALGVVMLMGSKAWQIYRLVNKVWQRILTFIGNLAQKGVAPGPSTGS